MAKPAQTKIKLRKRSDKLEMILPSHRQLTREDKHQIAAAMTINLVVVALVIGGVIYSLSGQPLILTIIPALLVSTLAAKTSAEMCKQLFSKTSVSIDQKQLAFSHKFWNFDWGAIRSIKVKDIQRVVATDYKNVGIEQQGKTLCYLLVEIDGQGTVTLLNAEHRLTKAEALWLGKEMSRWLSVRFHDDISRSG
jgi:hypothetical protein